MIRTEQGMIGIFAVSFFFASWLVANVPIGNTVTWVSALFIVLLAVPSYYNLFNWVGLQKSVLIIGVFAFFPILIETIGISTGFPYGKFHYTDQMGFKVFGLVPWSVAFAFAPLLLGSITIASQITRNARIVLPLSAIFLVIVDLILDPAAVVLNIWVWNPPGPYYGIPLSNYVGWFLTAFIGSLLLHLLTSRDLHVVTRFPSNVASSLLLSLSFWTGYSIWSMLMFPAAIGGTMLICLFYYVIIRNQVKVEQVQ